MISESLDIENIQELIKITFSDKHIDFGIDSPNLNCPAPR